MDLVRYQRNELHEAGLITNEEFADLVNIGSASARRLEEYDEMRLRLDVLECKNTFDGLAADLKKEIASLQSQLSEAREAGKHAADIKKAAGALLGQVRQSLEFLGQQNNRLSSSHQEQLEYCADWLAKAIERPLSESESKFCAVTAEGFVQTFKARAEAAESALSEMRGRVERQCPVIKGGFIPWSVAELVYIEYAQKHGSSQSLERIAERGGFGYEELDSLLPNWREHRSGAYEITSLRAKVEELEGQAATVDDATGKIIVALRAKVERLEGELAAVEEARNREVDDYMESYLKLEQRTGAAASSTSAPIGRVREELTLAKSQMHVQHEHPEDETSCGFYSCWKIRLLLADLDREGK
jgi:SMC interacting uncharacterized protein involved in chromosome segregation